MTTSPTTSNPTTPDKPAAAREGVTYERVMAAIKKMALGDMPGAVVVTLEGTRTDTPQPTASALTIPLQL